MEPITAADVQTAYAAVLRVDLNPTVAAAIADSINDGNQTFDEYVAGLIETASTSTVPAIAVLSFFEGSVPSEARVDSISAFANLQFDAYAAKNVGNPALGPYEAIGYALANEPAFDTQYGPGVFATSAEFISAIYVQVFGQLPSSGALSNLVSQLEGEKSLTQQYLNDNVDPEQAVLLARGAVMGQIIGYAFQPDPDNLVPDSPLVGQVDTFLENAATGDTTGFGAPLPPAGPVDGQSFTLTAEIDAPGISGPGIDTSGTDGSDTFLANSRTLNPGDEIGGSGGDDTVELSLGGNAFLADDTNDSLTSTSIETVQITAVPTFFGDVTIDMLEAIGVTTLRNFNSSADLYVEEVQNNLAIEVSNVDGYDFEVEFDDDALGSNVASLNVALTDSDVFLGLYTNGDDAVAAVNLTVEDDNFVTLDLSGDTEDELVTLTATGAGFLDIGDYDAEFENLATVDFSALSGGSFLDLSTNETDVTYTGGAGIDFVGFGAGEFDATDTVDGGLESDFLGVDIDDGDLLGGTNITNIENVVLGGALSGNVTIEDTEDLGFESFTIAATAGNNTLTFEEADGVVINYLGDDLFNTSNDSNDNNIFDGTIEFDSTDDVTFVVGINEDAEGQPTTGLEFFNDKFETGFDDADADLFTVDEFILDEVETIDLTLNGDFIVNFATISAPAFDDILETFTISGEGDFVLNGGTDSFDGLEFDLTALTGGFSNAGVGASGSQEFTLGDLGSASGAFENDASGDIENEFDTYDFDSVDSAADNGGTELGSVIALGGAGGIGGGDGARDIVTFTTGDFGNIAIEGFGITDPSVLTDDILDLSALVGNIGADLDFADNDDGTGVLITSDEFSGTILLVGVTEADLNGLADYTSIFGG